MADPLPLRVRVTRAKQALDPTVPITCLTPAELAWSLLTDIMDADPKLLFFRFDKTHVPEAAKWYGVWELEMPKAVAFARTFSDLIFHLWWNLHEAGLIRS